MSAIAHVVNRLHHLDAATLERPQPPRADLFNALRARSERMSLRTLERRGFRNVQVLDMKTIENVVAMSLTHMLERHTAVLSIEDRVRLELEAKREFAKLLAEHQGATQKSDAERSRETFERQTQGLRAELDRQKLLLDAEHKKNDGSTLKLSPESFKQMETKIRALFAHLVSTERRLSLSEAGPGALAGLSELEREVAAFLDRLLEGERERFIGSVRSGQSETVELLEKRILKLNKALAGTEEQLHRMAEMKQGDPGIASIYDSVQGLSGLEANFEKKKEILVIIFEENLKIQKNRKRHARIDVGSADPAPAERSRAKVRTMTPALTVPSRFEAPLEALTEEVAI